MSHALYHIFFTVWYHSFDLGSQEGPLRMCDAPSSQWGWCGSRRSSKWICLKHSMSNFQQNFLYKVKLTETLSLAFLFTLLLSVWLKNNRKSYPYYNSSHPHLFDVALFINVPWAVLISVVWTGSLTAEQVQFRFGIMGTTTHKASCSHQYSFHTIKI